MWSGNIECSFFPLSLTGAQVIRRDMCKVLLLFQERSQWLCVDSRSVQPAAGRFFTSASSALTPFICGYLSSCLPFCSVSLCLDGDVYLVESTLSGLLPVPALHNIQIFWRCCVQGHPDSSITSFTPNWTFFFLKVHVTENVHQRYSVICHLTVQVRFANRDLGFLLCLWCGGAENAFECDKKIHSGASGKGWTKSGLHFTGLFSNLSVPLQPATEDVDHHKRCSLWQVPEIHQAQAEEMKGGNTFTPTGLKNWASFLLQGEKRGFWGSCMSEI